MKFCFWWIFEGLLKYTCLGILLQFLGITQKYSLQLLTLLVLDTIPPTCCQGRTHQLRIFFDQTFQHQSAIFHPGKKENLADGCVHFASETVCTLPSESIFFVKFRTILHPGGHSQRNETERWCLIFNATLFLFSGQTTTGAVEWRSL